MPSGSGSGFFWDGFGHAVTNNHVIAGASRAIVRLADGRGFPARLVGRAPEHDLAVLHIGIGAGRWCDGQVLVINDILGMYSDFTPKFVRRYANLKDTITQAVADYNSDVREQRFPAKENTFAMDATIVDSIRAAQAESRAVV